MNKKFNAKQLTLLGLMTALLLLMTFTPLGYLNIGPLAITFNVIPVASRTCRWSHRRIRLRPHKLSAGDRRRRREHARVHAF